MNVRFCALLLRIGDLLDMSYDRACPLVLDAVSPLPAESIAHWTQYQRVTHRLTSPDRIEITAECETQDEHRYLHDWCTWLVREISTARGVMSHATRHSDWNPPAASIDLEGSIVIRPSKHAKYVAVDWQLELDPEAVFSRLIHDINTEPVGFLKELLQNALDATRCHLYERMAGAGLELPAYPQHAEAAWRDALPIRVTRSTTTRFNEMSQRDEERELVIIEDFGIGMDREVILNYLLQVGRSYYTSEDFARRFPFVPTSRFGVGFLSVFDTADEVRVLTRRSGADSSEGIALTLTGPRSYVLTERVDRPAPGTRVEVVLRRPIDIRLAEPITTWCKRVEFPILVTDHGETSEVRREEASDFTYEEPSALEEDETMGVEAVPVSIEGIEGEIYVFYRRTPHGESWADYGWATYTYPGTHPEARAPRLPDNLVSFHGIAMGYGGLHFGGIGITARLDYRKHLPNLALSRHIAQVGGYERLGLDDPPVHGVVVDLVRKHVKESGFAHGSGGWRYKQKLIEFTGLDEFWIDEPGTLRLFKEGKGDARSLREAASLEELPVTVRVISDVSRYRRAAAEVSATPPETAQHAVITPDFDALASQSRDYLLGKRSVVRAEWLDDEWLLVTWAQNPLVHRVQIGWGSQVADVVAIPGAKCVSTRLHKAFNETYDHVILNADNEFVQWVLEVERAALEEPPSIEPEKWQALAGLLAHPMWHSGYKLELLEGFVEHWRAANTGGLTPPVMPDAGDFVASIR